MDFHHHRGPAGTVVARIGSDTITAEELQERFGEMSPYARARYQTVEQRKDLVEGMVRFEAMAQEALRRGLQNDPDVVETAKKVMVQRLMQTELDGQSHPPTDEAIAQYYETHKSDFVKPEMFRFSDIFLKALKGDAATRSARKTLAETLRVKAQALNPLDFAGFGKLARENSEDEATKSIDGDLRYLSAEELSARYGPEVAAAAGSIRTSGQLSEVVETDLGVHLLKLQGRQLPLNLGLERVKAQIQGRILTERRNENLEKFVEAAKKTAHAEVLENELARVQVDMKAPTREAKGPPPGYIPTAGGPLR